MTDRDADFAAVKQAHDHFGRLDIVVNNAGYGHFGFIEELTEQEARAQIETNVFGALWVTQAALPYLRAQRSGHHSGVVDRRHHRVPERRHLPRVEVGARGFSQSLAQEVAPFNIHVTLIEPGDSPRTGRVVVEALDPLPDYKKVHEAADRVRAQRMSKPGDPKASAAAIDLEIVDAPEPPLACLLRRGPLQLAKADYENRLKTWQEWQPVSVLAQG